MSLGSWTPDTKKSQFTIDPSLLEKFIAISKSEQLESLTQQLNDDDIQQYAPLMQLPQEQWEQAGEAFSSNDIEDLIRFFTMAEKLPGWEAGNQSPVIWLGKILKKRGIGINKTLSLWIKEHSENRFLPHGSL